MAAALSDRARLRPAVAGDAEAAWRALSDPEVARWVHAARPPFDRTAAAALIARAAAQPGAWAVEVDGAFAGLVALRPGRGLSFWLARAYWGGGLMRSAAGAVLDTHFARTDRAVLSGHHPDNARSRRLLLALGFRDTDRIGVPVRPGGSEPVQRMQLTRARRAGAARRGAGAPGKVPAAAGGPECGSAGARPALNAAAARSALNAAVARQLTYAAAALSPMNAAGARQLPYAAEALSPMNGAGVRQPMNAAGERSPMNAAGARPPMNGTGARPPMNAAGARR